MTSENNKTIEQQPAVFTKKVGGTTYHVNVHFSKTSKETLADKILRLIRREGGGL